MNPFLRQWVYCCTGRKPWETVECLANGNDTVVASLRWQAQLQGHGAVLMRSLKMNLPFSAP
ncbi:hypothetical protein ACLK17_18545 [Escherichia coli]